MSTERPKLNASTAQSGEAQRLTEGAAGAPTAPWSPTRSRGRVRRREESNRCRMALRVDDTRKRPSLRSRRVSLHAGRRPQAGSWHPTRRVSPVMVDPALGLRMHTKRDVG